MEITAAVLTAPTGDPNFALNFELSYIDGGGEELVTDDARRSLVPSSSWQSFLRSIELKGFLWLVLAQVREHFPRRTGTGPESGPHPGSGCVDTRLACRVSCRPPTPGLVTETQSRENIRLSLVLNEFGAQPLRWLGISVGIFFFWVNCLVAASPCG